MDADWMDLLDEKNKEIERLQKQIRYQEHRHGRIGPHDPIFYEYGLSNYECALREIERLREVLRKIRDGARDVEELYAELFAEFKTEARSAPHQKKSK